MVWSTKTELVRYCGETKEATVTSNPWVADKWVTSILEEHKAEKMILVGFHCKYNKPPNNPIRSTMMTTNKIATLQLCVGTNCLILQRLHMPNIPRSVTNFLNDDAKVTLFGVEINENASKLQREYGMMINSSSCSNKKVDIRALAKTWFPFSATNSNSNCSLKGIAYKVAGLSMRKRGKCFINNNNINWETRDLDQELIAYASVDAYACYLIPHKLLRHITCN